ncbi:hypothetical protein Tco_0205517 [Tanacetum coccineum]
MKFLMNYPLKLAFTKCLSVLYQNLPREFWSTEIAYDLNPPVDDFMDHLLKEYLIKFLVMNGKSFTLNYKTFYSSIVLDYNNGKYVTHLSDEAVKTKLGKIANNASYLHKTHILKKSFPMAWRILFTFVIQDWVALDEFFNSVPITDHLHIRLPFTLPDAGICKSQPLLEGPTTDTKDSGGNIQPADKVLPSMVPNKGTAKTMPCLEGPLRDKHSEGNKPPSDMELINPSIDDLSGTGAEYQVDKTQSTRRRYQTLTKNEGKTSSEVEPGLETLQLTTLIDIQPYLLSKDELAQESDEEEPESPHTQDNSESASDSSCPEIKKYDNILPLIERKQVKYLRKASRVVFNSITKEQWEQHKEAVVSYADLKAFIEGYYEENADHKEQTNKLVQATMNSVDKNHTERGDLTETLKNVQEAVKDDPTLNKKSLVKSLHATALSQEKYLAEWAKSLTSMAWNLGPRMIAIEWSQAAIRTEISSLKQDTLDIKSMMTEIYQAFKNVTPMVTKEPLSHTEGETEDIKTQDTDEDKQEKEKVSEEPKPAVPISFVKPTTTPKDPDKSIRVPYMINGKMYHLINDEINVYLEKEDKIKKAEEEAKRHAMTKTEADEKFKKAQYAEMQVHKRQHTEKVKRMTELNKKRDEQYKWTISSRLKPEPITDVKIHPNTKLAVLTVYRNNDKRNFVVHNPFKFADFGITELDELGPIIQKKKNIIVKDLMQSLRRKKKNVELEPEIKVPRLECNRSLPKGVPFINNIVIEEPDYGIFFTDVFGNQAFQRWNDIHKVGLDSIVSYLVMDSMIKTLENAIFCLKLKKLIAEHPGQEKLKSKRIGSYREGMENRYMVTLVDGVLVNGVVMIFEMDIAFYAIQGTEILSLMIRLRILSIILPIFHTHLHNPNTCHILDYCNGKIDIEIKINELKENFNGMSIKIYKKKQLQQLEKVANLNTYPSEHLNSFCYDDDDDDDEDYTIAITPEKPVDSLIMEDEHLDTISEMKSDEFIKSSVENLVQDPSESEDLSDIESFSIPICYDDDDDEYSFATQEYLKKFSSAITPNLPKSDSLIMEDKHLDTIPEPESDELIKSSVEDLVHTPSEFDGISESECDLPVYDDSSPKKDEVLDDIISIPPGNGNDHFNAESSLIESMLNCDNVISSPKIDFLLEEFAGELTLKAPIPPGIVEANFDPKGDIRFIENLMYDNSFPRPPETLKDDSETVIDSNNDYSLSDDDSPYSEDIDCRCIASRS